MAKDNQPDPGLEQNAEALEKIAQSGERLALAADNPRLRDITFLDDFAAGVRRIADASRRTQIHLERITTAETRQATAMRTLGRELERTTEQARRAGRAVESASTVKQDGPTGRINAQGEIIRNAVVAGVAAGAIAGSVGKEATRKIRVAAGAIPGGVTGQRAGSLAGGFTDQARERIAATMPQVDEARRRVRLLEKTTAQESRGESRHATDGPGSGDKRVEARAAREAMRLNAAKATNAMLDEALSANLERKAMGDYRYGGRQDFESRENANLERQVEQNRLAQAQAEERRRVGLGGTGRGEFADRIRARQTEAIDTGLGRQQGESLEDLQKRINLEQGRQKQLASPEGRRAIREEAALKKQLAGLEDKNAFERKKQEMGPWNASLDAAQKKLEKMGVTLQDVGRFGTRAFAGIMTGAIGFASVADPFVTFPTFTESLKAMGIQLGTIVLPAIDGLSAALQKGAKWVSELSEGTKLWGTRTLVWVAAGGLMLSTIIKITTAAQALGIVLTTVRAKMIATGIGAAVVVVGALAAEYALLGDRASDAAKAIGAVGDATARLAGMRLKSESTIKASDIEAIKDERVKKAYLASAGDPKKLADVLRPWKESLSKDLEKAKALQAGPLAQRFKTDELIDRALEPIYRRRGPEGRENLERLRQAEKVTDIGQIWKMLFAEGEKFKGPEARREEADRAFQERVASSARMGFKEAAEAIEKAGGKIFFDYPKKISGPDFFPDVTQKRMAAAEAAERVKKGEIPASAILQRLEGLYGGGEPRRLEGRAQTRVTDTKLADAESQLKLSEKLLKAAEAGGDMKREVRFPAQPAIGSWQSFADQLQMQALTGGDISRQNQADQFRNAMEALARDFKMSLDDLKAAQREMWEPNRGHVAPRRR